MKHIGAKTILSPRLKEVRSLLYRMNDDMSNCYHGRPEWDEYFMAMAELAATRSTCLRRRVGAVLTKDNRILCSGYNGAPKGIPHCIDVGCLRAELDIPSGEQLHLCLHGKTMIKLLNGKYKSIAELTESYNGVPFWVYAVDTNTGKIVPAIAINPRKTDKRNDLIKVTFDNGKFIICTPDHRLMMRDCTFQQAGQLKPNDSMMPMYYSRYRNNHSDGLYEHIHNTYRQGTLWPGNWKEECGGRTCTTPTHRLVYEHCFGPIKKGYVIHHEDEDSLNNDPGNIGSIQRGKHTQHHTVGRFDKSHYRSMSEKGIRRIRELKQTSSEFRDKISENGRKSMNKLWGDKEFVKRHIERSRIVAKRLSSKSNVNKEHILLRQRGRILAGINKLFKTYTGKITIENYNELREKYNPKGKGNLFIPTIKSIEKYFNSFTEALELAVDYNHSVVSVEPYDGTHDVYDLTVPKYENFAVSLGDDSCIFAHNCQGSHAEDNTISQAAYYGISTEGTTLYCTNHPCSICAKLLINAGIVKIYYRDHYDDSIAAKLLSDAGIEVIQLEY